MHPWSRVAAALSAALALAACDPQVPEPARPELAIELRWVKGYGAEKRSQVETGLRWGLSFLGAALPSERRAFAWHDDRLRLDLDAAGILPETRAAWVQLLAVLKHSDEYQVTGGLDIGRFLVLTLCSSRQYFALTGAASSFEQFRRRHPFSVQLAAIVQSDIAHGNRLLEFGQGDRFDQVFVVAYEGHGSLARGDFEKAEIETIDFMPNGQLRFGLYGLEGQMKSAASAEFTDAAKPSKCLWCHEIRLQPPFKNSTDVAGYPSAEALRALIGSKMQLVASYRATLHSQIDYRRTDDHTFAELLYLSFSEPSAERLASEWRLPLAAVRLRLAGFKTHRNAEFRSLGNDLYDRAEVDQLAPYPTLRVPTQIREVSSYEPSLLTGPAGPGSPLP